MDENATTILDGEITGISFALANHDEIRRESISGAAINHSSQLGNPFLGLPLEYGKCESCGTNEPGKCEGHFGYIELPIPIYHPSHINELKRLLSLLCLKCLKLKNSKVSTKNAGISAVLLSACCEDAAQISVKDFRTTDGACFLQLKLPSRKKQLREGFWNFLERYGYQYGDSFSRTLLPSEAMEILRRIPPDTRKKLSVKGYFPQDGYIIQYLPVPPNCLSVPEISDGITVMSADQASTMLRKVLKQVEEIRSSRAGMPNFESHEVEANDLQSAVERYLEVRGTGKAARDGDSRFGVHRTSDESSTKAWLEKMRTLFIRKGSGFSSRSVITGDSYKGVDEVGIPQEIAQRITFEERVHVHNMRYLQELVDNKMCLTYKDGSSTYSLREGSKGHTFLQPGQVVHRRIMDGDIVFINRPPTTHKHSLQALRVYIHDDHTVKINPLICGPLSADFDGDCVHLFYPQSLAAKAEVLELFSVENQLLSSHTDNLNLQLASDSLLSLKMLFKWHFFDRAESQQLAMFAANLLPEPAIFKAPGSAGSLWTALQILQTSLPDCFDCCGDRYLITKSEVLRFDYDRDVLPGLINEILTSIFFEKGPKAVLKFFNSLQPVMMENLFSRGFSVSLEDFCIPWGIVKKAWAELDAMASLLLNIRKVENEFFERQFESNLRVVKMPLSRYILRRSALGDLIDSKSESALNKVIQQNGFLGLQLAAKGKFYSKNLVEDIERLYEEKKPFCLHYPTTKYGLIRSSFCHGLDPFEEIVHSISSREVIVRSSRGLTEPGTLFKNLMAILRDVVVCYDGTVRNVCSNLVIQFDYGVISSKSRNLFPAGEPVGVLAATAMSNPAYKAVLDSSSSSNSSWQLMKEILLCKVKFQNDLNDRRVILYLNDCHCGKNFCQERAAFLVQKHLQKISLKDVAVGFTIEYMRQQSPENSETDGGLVGLIHLNKERLNKNNLSMQDILLKCQDTIYSEGKRKKVGLVFKRIVLSTSECLSCESKWSGMPCLMFSWQDANDSHLERTSHILADMFCPKLLDTVIKGDPRVCAANVIWMTPSSPTWIRNHSKSQKGELALDIILEKKALKQSGDAWRIVMDSCLPVLHMIDTRRSIPYAIKQVQELLGISAAFEQAVQRLSTSVTMVTKGVLKEHILLLANSMTSAGNLVGFNIGGYKALSHSLNVQVPFTEATLYTPRKCFERAAEKCHVDKLSSIVGSCSWGKHVAVGTGSRFDVLWDTKEVGKEEVAGTDVYSFLHMVRFDSNGTKLSDTGLGADIDELDDENIDFEMSPERTTDFGKPVFEDVVEIEPDNNDHVSSWDKVCERNNVPNAGGGWTAEPSVASDSNGWGKPWGKNNKAEENSVRKNADGKSQLEPVSRSSVWGDKSEVEQSATWGQVQGTEKSSSAGSWGKKTEEAVGNKAEGANTSTWGDPSRNKSEVEQLSAWGQAQGTEKSPSAGPWGKKTEETVGNKAEGANTSTWGNSWGNKSEVEQSSSWGQAQGTENSPSAGPWGKKTEEAVGNKAEGANTSTWGNSWGNKSEVEQSSSWGQAQGTENSPSAGPWGKKTEEAVGNKAEGANTSTWGNSWGNKSEMKQSSTWGQVQGTDKSPSAESWQKKIEEDDAVLSKPWGNKVEADTSTWGKPKGKLADEPDKSNFRKPWGKKAEEVDKSLWKNTNEQSEQAFGVTPLETETESSEPATSHGWGSKAGSWDKNSQPATPHSWGSPKAGGNEGENGGQWGQRSGSKRNRGWVSSDEWKNKKSRPPKSPGVFNEESASGTNARQWLDRFTSDEQEVLATVDPIMQEIRKIMHQSGYNDGDQLSAEHQTYVIDNVFNHHPDKAGKAGLGIDHVIVNKHSTFTESRCFYIVSSDGRQEDFSTVKCLKNFVIEKFPDKAEEFISKYWSRRERERERSMSVAPSEAGDASTQ